MAERIVLRVEPQMRELMPGFLANRKKDVARLRRAVARSDRDSLYRIGHSLKGVGASYGVDAISELGSRLESAAQEGRMEDAADIVREYADFLKRIAFVFE